MEKQQLKRCPIGIQTFEEIINKDYLYIDKTEYIYRMANGASKYCFLSRPGDSVNRCLLLRCTVILPGRKTFLKACHRKAGNRVDRISGTAF